MKQPRPAPGMGATVHVGADCYAATILTVSPSGKTLTIRYDRSILTKSARAALAGDWGAPQTHLFILDPEAPIKKVRLHKTGCYHVVGYGSTGIVTVGKRRTYRDPSH